MPDVAAMEYDPYSPEFQADPFAAYRWMLEEAPVFYSEKWNWWALSRFDLDLSRVWQGWSPVDGAQDFDHEFCSVGRGGDRLSRRWRRVPRPGYCAPGRRGCRDRVRSGLAGS